VTAGPGIAPWCARTTVGGSGATARQLNPELGQFANLAVNPDRAAVLLGDDVVADRQAKPGTLAGRLGSEKGLEQALFLDVPPDAGDRCRARCLNRIAQIAS